MPLFHLPDEIVHIIINFLGLNSELSIKFSQISNSQHKELISRLVTLETISKQFSEWMKLNSFSEFWFNLLEYEAKNCKLTKEWKEEVLYPLIPLNDYSNSFLRRKVLLVRWARSRYLTYLSERKLIKTVKNSKYEDRYVLMFGQDGVGVTSIINQFIYNQFDVGHYYYYGFEDTFRKQLKETIFINILNLDFKEENISLLYPFIQKYHSAIYVFSTMYNLSEEGSTFDFARLALETLVRAKDRSCNDFPVLFAINKIDIPENERLERLENIYSIIGKLTEKYDLRNTAIFETSAKSRINIQEIFDHVVKMEDFEKFPFLSAFQDILGNDTQALSNMFKRKTKKCILC